MITIMSFESLSFGVYGLFVWSAFVFTFLTLFFLHKKIKNEFVKLEKMYLSEFRLAKAIKITSLKKKKYIPGNPVF